MAFQPPGGIPIYIAAMGDQMLSLAGKIADGDTIHVSAGEGGLLINGEMAAAA